MFLDGHFSAYLILLVAVWAIWAVKAALARGYRPYTGEFTGTASVIIPVVDEPEELFRAVVRGIVVQRPLEVIVVINGAENPTLARICAEERVRWIHTPTAGKRNALKLGLAESRGDVAVLVDSDTTWTSDTLSELLKPFADPTVGGVTTNQRILKPRRNILTRWASWLESIRTEYSMPAMSRRGSVGCLPGRTIAFRRHILERNMSKFLSERFLGVFLEVSDDRTLTNYTLLDGYKTVYQSTSIVYTDAPTTLGKLVRQQHRWARGSQYNTLRMARWMVLRRPLLALYYFSDILIPFALVGCAFSWLGAPLFPRESDLYANVALTPRGGGLVAIVLLALGMTALSVAMRYSKHFAKHPRDLLFIPLFMAINTFVLIPIRVIGFFRCAHNAGWGTRAGGFAGEGSRGSGAWLPPLLGAVLLVVAVAAAFFPDRGLLT